MAVQPTEHFEGAAKTEPKDPSVAYAEAVLEGKLVVTVQDQDGRNFTYRIGQEFNYDQ